MEFSGKTAFITGAGGFLGSAIAKELAGLGANVAICDINEHTVAATAEAVRAAGGAARVVACDVRASASVDAAVAEAVAVFGGLDIMIHVAGGSARVNNRPLIEQTDEVINETLGVNLMGAIYTSRAAGRVMAKQGRGGRILLFASAVGINGLARCSDYGAAKGGVIAMVKTLAKELGSYKITVNSVSPGCVARPGDQLPDSYKLDTNYLHEQCTAEDVAELVTFLASDRARMITGANYIIDGGRTLAMKGSD